MSNTVTDELEDQIPPIVEKPEPITTGFFNTKIFVKNWFFSESGSIDVRILAFEKRGDGINAYIVYKIETKVSGIPGYNKNVFEVWRRFSDFLGLREKLVEKYQHQGIIVPLAPEKSLSALTKTKLTEENNSK